MTSPSLTLTFDPPNWVRACKVSERTPKGDNLIIIVQSDGNFVQTVFRQVGGKNIASVSRNWPSPDVITLDGQPAIGAKKFHRSGFFSFYPVTFTHDGVDYVWKKSKGWKNGISLYNGPSEDKPIAILKPCPQFGPNLTTTLELFSGAILMRDMVVFSAFLLDQKRRLPGKGSEAGASTFHTFIAEEVISPYTGDIMRERPVRPPAEPKDAKST